MWFGGRVSRNRSKEEGGLVKGYFVVEGSETCCVCVLGGGLGGRLVVVDLTIGLWADICKGKKRSSKIALVPVCVEYIHTSKWYLE